MKVVKGLLILILLNQSVAFSIEEYQPCTNVNISLKDNSPLMDITPTNNEKGPSPLYLNVSIEDTPIINNLHFSFNSELIPSTLINHTQCTYFEKTENLNFQIVSWIEEVKASEWNEIRHYYFILLKHSNQVLLWVESEKGIKSCELHRNENQALNATTVKTKNALVFTTDPETKSAIVPIVPTILKEGETDKETFCFIKEPQFVPSILGFLITLAQTSIPLVNVYPSDIGPEYGVQINLLSDNPNLPFYNIFINPGNTVTSYNKERFEIWGKSCIIEHEKGVYNTLAFIDIRAFTYNKGKTNQWSVAFYSPIKGYLQLNGKISSIYNTFLHGDAQNKVSKIRGLCQIENSDYFDFEVPSCVESKIPFPEQIILGITKKK